MRGSRLFTSAELDAALASVSASTATSPYIVSFLLELTLNVNLEALVTLRQGVMEWCNPSVWKVSRVTPLLKLRMPMVDFLPYCLIALASSVGKVIERINFACLE